MHYSNFINVFDNCLIIISIKKKEIETLSTQIKKTKDDGALQDLKQAKKNSC